MAISRQLNHGLLTGSKSLCGIAQSSFLAWHQSSPGKSLCRAKHSQLDPGETRALLCSFAQHGRSGSPSCPVVERARDRRLPWQQSFVHNLHPSLRPAVRLLSYGTNDAKTSVSNTDDDPDAVASHYVDPLREDVTGNPSPHSAEPPTNKVIFVEEDLMEDGPGGDIDILEERENPDILQHYADVPLLPESYSLASYVDRSETLQKLVQMGVDLSRLQRRRGVADMLLKMDFEKDVKDRLAFLHRAGVQGEKLGAFITRNPFILGEELQNVEARVHFLLEKGFPETAVAQIVNRAPYFLNFSIERIDSKLGFYQQLFALSDSQIREIITRCPKLVTMKVSRPKENLSVLEFQCGFSKNALRSMVLREPSLLLRGKFQLLMVFDYLHNAMKIPHNLLLQMPRVFLGRIDRVKDRHKYLCSLRRDQYDPKEPGYVPLLDLFKLPDDAFCQNIAKTPLEDYETFLKACRV